MSKLVGLLPVRNEDWILGLSLRALLLWCDAVVVGLHACTDKSETIVHEVMGENPGRIVVREFSDPIWTEMAHRQALLEIARGLNPSHLVMVDADEVLTANLLPTIRRHVERAPPGHTMTLPWQCLRGSLECVHTSGVWGVAQVCMAFRDDPAAHWVARSGYDFHHRHPMGRPYVAWSPIGRKEGGLMHLQFVDGRRLRAKQSLYELIERLRWPGRETPDVTRKRYSLAVYGDKGIESFGLVPPDWWAEYRDRGWLNYLDPGAEPWQIEECRRILRENPGIGEGLDFFGLKL